MTRRLVSVDSHEADRDLRRIATLLSDLRPFWPRVRRLFVGWQRLQFDSEGAFWGEGRAWTPLSPRYAARKRILWGDRPILQASGQAKRAAMTPIQTRVGPRSLTLAIDDAGKEHPAILAFHQVGAGDLPRRPVIGERLPALAARELQNEADAYVRDFLRRF